MDFSMKIQTVILTESVKTRRQNVMGTHENDHRNGGREGVYDDYLIVSLYQFQKLLLLFHRFFR